MEKLTRLTPADRDNLVAYLDGELDEESSRRVESALAQSNVARTDVEQLARTYELLDLIDRPQASVEFTERTIASVKLEQFKPALSQQRWFQPVKRYGQRGLWTLAIVIAGAIGYSISHLAVPLTDDQIIEEFPLLEKVDVYREVGTYDFLDRLSRESSLLEQMQREARSDAN